MTFRDEWRYGITFVNSKHPRTKIKNKHNGRASWKDCAVGEFIKQTYGVDFYDDRGYRSNTFHNIKQQLMNDLNAHGQGDVGNNLRRGQYTSYGELQYALCSARSLERRGILKGFGINHWIQKIF